LASGMYGRGIGMYHSSVSRLSAPASASLCFAFSGSYGYGLMLSSKYGRSGGN